MDGRTWRYREEYKGIIRSYLAPLFDYRTKLLLCALLFTIASFAYTDVFLLLSVGLLNIRIQIRAKLSCFACLFRACRRLFVILMFFMLAYLPTRCGRSFEILRGVWRDVPSLCPRRRRSARQRTRQADVCTLGG